MYSLINNVDSIILAFVQGSFGGLTTVVQTFWNLMFTVFIAFYGYKIFISGRFSTSDLIMHCIKIILVLVLATQWGAFFTLIYRMVTDLPSDISGQIMQAASVSLGAQSQAATAASANTLLGQFYDRALAVCAKLLDGAGWSQPGPYLYVAIIWITAAAFTCYATMLIILSKLAVAVIMAVGPVFILLLIFHDTKKLFEGWLRTLLNYAMIPIFVYALLALLLAIVLPTLVYLENHTGIYDQIFTALGPFVAATFIATLLLQQAIGISANITGGIALSTMRPLSQAINATKGAYKGISGGYAAGKSAYKAGRAVINYGNKTYKAGTAALQKALGNIGGNA
jgi:type IV secretion system protein VirB6